MSNDPRPQETDKNLYTLASTLRQAFELHPSQTRYSSHDITFLLTQEFGYDPSKAVEMEILFRQRYSKEFNYRDGEYHAPTGVSQAATGANQITRVKWNEDRAVYGGGTERFTVIADFVGGKWEISESTSWEVRWYEPSSSDLPRLEARLREELAARPPAPRTTAPEYRPRGLVREELRRRPRLISRGQRPFGIRRLRDTFRRIPPREIDLFRRHLKGQGEQS